MALKGILTQSAGNIFPPSGDISMGGFKITNLGDPTAATDAANKEYVDAFVSGLTPLAACRVATTAALTATYSNGTAGVGATLTNATTQAAISIDGVSLSASDRVLVKDQAAPAQNGLYTVTTVGSGATNWVLTRATDFDTSAEMIEGSYTNITAGTVNQGEVWLFTTSSPVVVGTTALNFSQFGTFGTMSTQNANAVAITGGTIDGTNIGATTAGTGKFSTLITTSTSTIGGDVTLNNGIIIKSDTTTAHTAVFAALYDVDNTTYRNFIVGTNGNTPTLAISAPSGGAITIDNTVIGSGTAAAATVTTLAVNSTSTFSDDITIATGKAIKTDTTSAHTLKIQGYTGAAYSDLITVTNAATPTLTISGGAGTFNNMVIGNSTPLAGSFTTLTASSTSVFSGDVTIASGIAIKGDTTTAHTWLQQGYDNTASTYRTFVTVTNGNTTTWALASPTNGSVTINGAVIGGVTPAAATFTTLNIANGAIATSGNITFSGAYAFTGTLTNTTNVTFPTSGTLLSTAAVVTAAQGGTGVANNAASTITISGNFGTTFTVTGSTSVTLPTSGTLTTLATVLTTANSWGATQTFADNVITGAELKDYSETTQTVSAATTTTIDFTAGGVILLSQDTAITTFNITNPSPTGKACRLTIIRTKDNTATARTITWPSGTIWTNGVTPTLSSTANAVDIFSLVTTNAGTTWYGFTAGQAFA